MIYFAPHIFVFVYSFFFPSALFDKWPADVSEGKLDTILPF